MIRSWILYILTVGVVFVFTILYGKQSGFLLCLLTVLLPLIYAALTIILASRMGFDCASTGQGVKRKIQDAGC